MDNQVQAAAAMASQVGSDPEGEFHFYHQRRVMPRRFDEHKQLGGRITSGSLLGELIVLREESVDGIPLK